MKQKFMHIDDIVMSQYTDTLVEFAFMDGIKECISVVVTGSVAQRFIEVQMNLQFNMEQPDDCEGLSDKDIQEKIDILKYFILTMETEQRRRVKN